MHFKAAALVFIQGGKHCLQNPLTFYLDITIQNIGAVESREKFYYMLLFSRPAPFPTLSTCAGKQAPGVIPETTAAF